MEQETVWFVGKNIGDGRCELQGIFRTREKALKACRKSEYFIMRVMLDEQLPDETIQILEFEYPLL